MDQVEKLKQKIRTGIDSLAQKMQANTEEKVHFCPWCGKCHDRLTDMEGHAQPRDGDYGICLKCHNVSVWEGGSPRMATEEETKECLLAFLENLKNQKD